MYILELLFFLLLPFIGYLFVIFVGNLLNGRFSISGESLDDPDSGTTGAIGIFALLLIIPAIMLMLGIPKEYYWYVAAALIVFANKDFIARLLKSPHKHNHKIKQENLPKAQSFQATAPVVTQTQHIKKITSSSEQGEVIIENLATNSKTSNASSRPEVVKITVADNTEKILKQQKEAQQAQQIEAQRISAEGWIYFASEKRLFNETTGEDLYTFSPLGFSIGKDEFILHNKKNVRRITISEVQKK